MNPAWIAGLVLIGVMWLVAAVICTSAKHNDQAAARLRHPSNWTPYSAGTHNVMDFTNWKLSRPSQIKPTAAPSPVHVVPLICPGCLTAIGQGRLSVSGEVVGGWVEPEPHVCKQVTV